MRNVFGVMVALVVCSSTAGLAQHWPHWRGPSHDGVSTEKGLPDTWSATCADKPATGEAGPGGPFAAEEVETVQRGGQRPGRGGGGNFEGRPIVPTVCASIATTNVAWKLPLPAYSGSTPIIWGETIFLNVATATNSGVLELWSIDRNKQTVNWKRLITDSNHMERKQNMSSPSPVTDGKYVWVMTGLGVLKAFDFGGKEVWARNIQADYGKFGL
ncbi:MAG: hypothetical protein RJA55_1099, partial [Acidobacteriota bacterium]